MPLAMPIEQIRKGIESKQGVDHMIKLIKNVDVYAPDHLGKKDVLVAGKKVAAIEDRY
jgi:hypothetical protein